MEDLSLHVLDIAENAVTAGATRVDIRITEHEKEDIMIVEIEDDGKGMDEHELKRAMDPFFTTKQGKRVGLGLSLLSQAAREADGGLDVQSRPGQGTIVKATFKRSHIDRKPLGDMTQTLSALIAGFPGVRFTFTYHKGETTHSLDTAQMWTNGFWTTVGPDKADEEKV